MAFERSYDPVHRTLIRRRAVSLGVGAAAACLAMGIAITAFSPAGTIVSGVSIAGVSVGGMDAATARTAVERHFDHFRHGRVRLVSGRFSTTCTVSQLGAAPDADAMVADAIQVAHSGSVWTKFVDAWNVRRHGCDIAPRFRFDDAQLEQALRPVAAKVNQPAVDASAAWVDGSVHMVNGTWGTVIDRRSSEGKIKEALAAGRTPVTVELAVSAVRPTVSYEDLQSLNCVLASYSTAYHASQRDRTHNLVIAASRLDKTLLRPGEVFSYNTAVGERLARYGFRTAPIFSNGDVVPEIGGGVCQVATTQYNVCLLAGLDVLERRCHSRPVAYAPKGRDATVYWGQTDLRVRNNLSHPVYLRCTVGGGRVRMCLLGNREDQEDVDLEMVSDNSLPYKTVVKEDPSLPAGTRKVDDPGRLGWKTQFVRIMKRHGEVIRRESLRPSYYPPADALVRVGTGPATTPPPNADGQTDSAEATSLTLPDPVVGAPRHRVEDEGHR